MFNRFCGKKPILSTMYSEDLRQRGRFIWSNITICEKNVAAFRKYDIFIKKMNRKDKGKIKFQFQKPNTITLLYINKHFKYTCFY